MPAAESRAVPAGIAARAAGIRSPTPRYELRRPRFWTTVLQFVLTRCCICASMEPCPVCSSATSVPWIADWGVYYAIGLDGVNILLVMLTAFLGPLVILGAFTAIEKDVALFYVMVLLLQFAMMGASWPRTSSCSMCSGRRC
jgi:NADH:ubiquinone oxidoreductase subunit 4 (subunit M)